MKDKNKGVWVKNSIVIMYPYQKKHIKNKNNLPIYCIADCAITVFENISLELREKFSLKEIFTIFNLLDDYFFVAKINHHPDHIPVIKIPTENDDDQLFDFVTEKASHKKINVCLFELQEMFQAELIYLEKINAIGNRPVELLN